jgi:Signal transduction histidine kinase regulating C4-dicarboxylate transport system
MNKNWLLIVLFLNLLAPFSFAGQNNIDSLLTVVRSSAQDSNKVNSLIALSSSLLNTDGEKAREYANEAKMLADKLNFKKGQAYALKGIGMSYYFQGKYIETLLYWEKSLSIFQALKDKRGISNMLNNLGAVNFNQGDDEKAINYYLESLKVAEEIGDKLRIATVLVNLGAVYFNKESTQELALQYYLKALPLSEELKDNDAIGTSAVNIGEIYLKKGDDNSALKYFEKALEAYTKTDNGNVPYAMYNIGRVFTHRRQFSEAIKSQGQAYEIALKSARKKEMAQAKIGLAEAYRAKGDNNMAISAYKDALPIAQGIGANYELKNISLGLAELYALASDFKNAFSYQKLYTAVKDTLYNADMDKKLQSMALKFDLEKKQGEVDSLEKDKKQKEQENRLQQLFIISISGALLSALFLSLILYRNNKHKQRSNAMLQSQKEELQHTLEKLKETQSQLIHAEKMASLGELTAGIAHEIQNPLNFVNNFSEVSKELLDEMTEELNKGNIEDAKEIANDIIQNLEKINYHGKRADAIVKGMLQHSRSNTGLKEPTDLNVLSEEYLRLSYHGLRAKDKSFNASMKSDFDPSLGKVNVIPQDMGRVILNLLTNAFYAVNEKRKTADENYMPEVAISTKRQKDKVVIKVKDNANGIPEHALGKIFQPFYTTKPTGEGTGLGLSLSYDIITKGHNGQLLVDTKEGLGTEFTIELPV